MPNNVHDELKELSPSQRTLFHAMKRRFGGRLGLSDEVLLDAVRRIFVPPHYAPGKSILREGDLLDLFTVLGAGTVKVTCLGARNRTVILQMVADGHAFGLPSLARAREGRRFGAVAHSQALVGLVTPDALRDVIDQLDAGRRLRMLTYGWNASIGLLLEKRLLLSLPVADRIWYALGRLALRFPSGARESGAIDLHLTQTDIGELVGSTRPTACRELKALGRQVVSGHRGHYVVHHQPPFAGRIDFGCPAPSGSLLGDDVARRDVLYCLRQRAQRMGLSSKAIEAFAHNARLVVCAPGAQIALPDRSEALSLLVSGAARVECLGPAGDPLTLLFAKPGQLIVGGVSSGGGVGFRAVAHVESCAAILTRDGLERVVAAMSAAEMLQFLAFGWRAFSHHFLRTCLFLTMKDEERVRHQLEQLATDFAARHDAGTIIDLPLTRIDIARLVAASEASVSRCLAKLERDGRIAFVDGPSKRIVVVGLFPNLRAA